MNVAELLDIEASYDKVGVYDQDAINGFSEQTLNTMLDLVNPEQASNILDAMAGNGNLTLRLYDYCKQCGVTPPPYSPSRTFSRTVRICQNGACGHTHKNCLG